MVDSENEMFLTQNTFMQDEKDDAGDCKFRFAKPLTEKDISKRLMSTISKRTKMKNDWALRILKRWQGERIQRSINDNLGLPQRCLTGNLVDMNATDMNTVLKFFVFETRKQDGTHYPASTLYGLFAAFASTLKDCGSPLKLFEDEEFVEARKALDAAMKEKSAMGLGTNSREPTEVISYDEENALWKKGALGEESPKQLVDTVLYLTGLHFALRGGKEHRSLRMYGNPQITGPHLDENGKRYLLYTEDVSKTNPGGIKQRNMKAKQVRAYENLENPSRCYVRLHGKYKSLCPKTSKSKDAFYLTPLKIVRENEWFQNTPIGHNTLQDTVKRLCKSAGIAGHRSDAVRIYKRSSDEQKVEVSSIIGNKSRKISHTVSSTEESTASMASTASKEPKEEMNVPTQDVTTSGNRHISLTFNFK